MKKVSVPLLMAAFLAGTVSSQTVNLCGTVTDPSGAPLTHTVVRLSVTTHDNGYWATAPYLGITDQNGRYHLGTGTCNVQTIVPNNGLASAKSLLQPVYKDGKVRFSLPAGNAVVKMGMYDLSGRFVREVLNKPLSKGNYSVGIDLRGVSSQFYLLRVTINGTSTVLKIRPSPYHSTGEVVQSAPGYQTRLEKLAAVVDTIHATEPGYTIGVKAIDALEGQNDFVLTKNNTWNGDLAAFWGDTSTYPRPGSTPQYVFLNRTNGKWPDSKISWSSGALGNGQTGTAFSTNNRKPLQGERMYIYIAPGDSNRRYFDFLEVNSGGTNWLGNSTRVDGWRLPITFRIKTTNGRDTVMGDSYELFFQTRESKFAEYINEVPQEFTHLATRDFANIWAPHTCPTSYFNTNQKYADYFKRYQDSVLKNYVKDPTWTTQHVYPNAAGDPGPMPALAPMAWSIFACTGKDTLGKPTWQVSVGGSPWWSAAMNRHVAHMTPHGIDWHNWGYEDFPYFYEETPANFFSRWCHRRSINDYCYGFPYDDNGDHQAFMGLDHIQWIAVAIGW